MRRSIAVFLIFICAFLVLAGTALAGAAPSATSYFTHPGYNKTYTDNDGLSHSMTVKWVGETWNKLGTVIYSINYEDVYQKDGNTYIDAMNVMEIYENARPSYPDSQRHSVYQVKWYSDGRMEVVSDYRPAEPDETSPPAPPEQPASSSPPAAEPSPTPESPPSPAPADPPSVDETDKTATKPPEKATPKPATEAAAPTRPPTSESAMPSSPVPAEETPAVTEAQGTVANESVAPSPSAPTPEEETEHPSQNADASPARWVWLVIVLAGIGAAILLAFYLEGRHGKEEKDNEEHKA